MPEAYAERRDAGRERLHNVDENACVFGPPGAGGEDDARGMQRADLFDAQLIVADDADVWIDRANELVEVIGKAIVIVDQKDHRSSSCASVKALTTAFALLMHS